jgi:hypothetical protein
MAVDGTESSESQGQSAPEPSSQLTGDAGGEGKSPDQDEIPGTGITNEEINNIPDAERQDVPLELVLQDLFEPTYDKVLGNIVLYCIEWLDLGNLALEYFLRPDIQAIIYSVAVSSLAERRRNALTRVLPPPRPTGCPDLEDGSGKVAPLGKQVNGSQYT